jgi:hypothetical protein
MLQKIGAAMVPKAQDHDISKWLQIPNRLRKLLACPEKKWPMNAENGDVGRNVLVLEKYVPVHLPGIRA